ncbi:(Fe-S)-binding protein [Peribacillus muralis]|uniref:(Fe-S)-binding protein n=1 Tax=Peribacillus muralis TaxID=264697 RepID=UPI001F4E4928|nr:(Fe-S)-binding protein [Peribacillus muralis]MCK1995361.1 (Fe-S)-binding protein [Peribacillus muralis]MCK2015892.1 (Fe-S)-binding protein [Peribacillus muralis]
MRKLIDLLPYEETIQCVRCGYCLPACPTYLTMGTETHSPRGRINLVKMAAEGHLSISDLENPIELCLGCRACETACPSGVQYGKILEGAKEAIYKHKSENISNIKKTAQDALFMKLFPNSQKWTTIADLLWLYQTSGLQKVAHKGNLTKVLPENLSVFEGVMPNVTSPLARRKRPTLFPAVNSEKPIYKVAFFTGCIMDALFEKINRLSMELLSRAGCEVHVIQEQTCCGALHAHAGRKDDSVTLAKKNIEVFESIEVDFIVNNAGGCGALLIEYDHLLAEQGDEWTNRAKAFVKKTKDISQILFDCKVSLNQPVNATVTYQRSCHMTNVQKVTEEPVALLKQIPGIVYKEMENPHMCCGSAGIYNVVNYKESMEVLDEKMIMAKKTDATIVVTTNPGCLLQMKLGVQREGLNEKVRVVHLVELLAAAAGLGE